MPKTCPVCTSAHTIVDDTPLSVYRCLDCHHLFTPIPPSEQETYSEEYFYETHHRWFEHPDKRFFRWIIRKLNLTAAPGKTLLDCGCGRGDLLKYMQSNGVNASLYGIDITHNTDPGITYFQGDFISYPLTEQFDFLVSTMVIEHVDNPIGFVKKVNDVVKPGGQVVMNTINSGAIIHKVARLGRALGIRVVFDRLYSHHHLQHYTTESLAKLMERGGFTIISQRTHNFPVGAMDVPKAHPVIEGIYRFGAATTFFVSNIFGGGLCQTVICRKDSPAQ